MKTREATEPEETFQEASERMQNKEEREQLNGGIKEQLKEVCACNIFKNKQEIMRGDS
jgi:hypothetical protein